MWRWLLGGVAASGIAVATWRFFTREQELPPSSDVPIDPSSPPPGYVQVQSGKWLESNAAKAFIAMESAANAAGHSLRINSAWRSRAHQERLYVAWSAYLASQHGGPPAPWAAKAAKPGTSKHQVGEAVDLLNINPAQSSYNAAQHKWLQENARKYGFIDDVYVPREHWHWSYRPSLIA